MKTKTAMEELLEILQILKSENIDIRIIPQHKKENGKQVGVLLKDIKSGNINEIIEKYGLDPSYKIGMKINGLIRACNGKGTYAITDEQKDIAINLLGENNEKGTERLLHILECLQLEGIDIRRIKQIKRINGKIVSTKLKDIKQNGINIEEVIKAHNLDGNYLIGDRIKQLRQKYNNDFLLPNEKEKVEKLQIITYKSGAERIFDVLDVLSTSGVDIGKIKLVKKVNHMQQSTTLLDIKQDGIDIEQIIKDNNLDGNYKIGMQIAKIRQGYRDKKGINVTESEKRRAEKLGIISASDMQAEQLKLQEKLKLAKELEKSVEGER